MFYFLLILTQITLNIFIFDYLYKQILVQNLALRHQISVLKRNVNRASLKNNDRLLWIILSIFWNNWKSALLIVKPETVIKWHRKGFKLFWKWKAKPGRPKIPKIHINFIRKISYENPLWGADRIAGELKMKFGILHSPSTIQKYMIKQHKPRKPTQNWKTFLLNHSSEIYACDFFTEITALFNVFHIFIIMEIGSRRIVHFNITKNPTLL